MAQPPAAVAAKPNTSAPMSLSSLPAMASFPPKGAAEQDESAPKKKKKVPKGTSKAKEGRKSLDENALREDPVDEGESAANRTRADTDSAAKHVGDGGAPPSLASLPKPKGKKKSADAGSSDAAQLAPRPDAAGEGPHKTAAASPSKDGISSAPEVSVPKPKTKKKSVDNTTGDAPSKNSLGSTPPRERTPSGDGMLKSPRLGSLPGVGSPEAAKTSAAATCEAEAPTEDPTDAAQGTNNDTTVAENDGNAETVEKQDPVGAAPASSDEQLELEERSDNEVEDGARYKGQWHGSLRHGYGVLAKRDGRIYQGCFVVGRAHGHGKFISTNGTFEGQWVADQAHGEGRYDHIDGSNYTGEWQHDKKSGSGVEEWADGSKYTGQFANGFKHGQGIYVSASGTSYEGQFAQDKMDGHGSYKFPDGRSHIGQFRAGHMNGSGSMEWPNGCKYTGSYQNDMKHGEGTFKWVDGRAYHGQWHCGKQHGRGVLVKKDGQEVRAVWKEGKMTSAQPYEMMEQLKTVTTTIAAKSTSRERNSPDRKANKQSKSGDSDASSGEDSVGRTPGSGDKPSRASADLALLAGAKGGNRGSRQTNDLMLLRGSASGFSQVPSQLARKEADMLKAPCFTPEGSASEDEDSLPEPTPPMVSHFSESELQTVTFRPGSVNLTFLDGGVVRSAPPGGQAHTVGVREGWTIVRVSGQNVDTGSKENISQLFEVAKARGVPYRVTFATVEKAHSKAVIHDAPKMVKAPKPPIGGTTGGPDAGPDGKDPLKTARSPEPPSEKGAAPKTEQGSTGSTGSVGTSPEAPCEKTGTPKGPGVKHVAANVAAEVAAAAPSTGQGQDAKGKGKGKGKLDAAATTEVDVGADSLNEIGIEVTLDAESPKKKAAAEQSKKPDGGTKATTTAPSAGITQAPQKTKRNAGLDLASLMQEAVNIVEKQEGAAEDDADTSVEKKNVVATSTCNAHPQPEAPIRSAVADNRVDDNADFAAGVKRKNSDGEAIVPIGIFEVQQWLYQLDVKPELLQSLHEEQVTTKSCGCLPGRRRAKSEVPNLSQALQNDKNFVLYLSEEQVNLSDLTQWHMLQFVHAGLTRSKVCPAIGGHWEPLGFMNSDPRCDLNRRPGGLLSLVHLFFFFAQYKELCHAIYWMAVSQAPFPLAQVSIRITQAVIKSLQKGRLSAMINLSSSTNGVLETTRRVHAAAFFNFYMLWREPKRRDLMQAYIYIVGWVEKNPSKLVKDFDRLLPTMNLRSDSSKRPSPTAQTRGASNRSLLGSE